MAVLAVYRDQIDKLRRRFRLAHVSFARVMVVFGTLAVLPKMSQFVADSAGSRSIDRVGESSCRWIIAWHSDDRLRGAARTTTPDLQEERTFALRTDASSHPRREARNWPPDADRDLDRARRNTIGWAPAGRGGADSAGAAITIGAK